MNDNVQLNVDTFYELCQYLTLAELLNLCKSNKEIQRLCQSERLPNLFQQKFQAEERERKLKLVNEILQNSANGFKYTIVPNKHILTYHNGQNEYISIVTEFSAPDYIMEMRYNTEKQSVLIELFGDKISVSSETDVGNRPFTRYMLYDSTQEQLMQVISALVNLPNFDIKLMN